MNYGGIQGVSSDEHFRLCRRYLCCFKNFCASLSTVHRNSYMGQFTHRFMNCRSLQRSRYVSGTFCLILFIDRCDFCDLSFCVSFMVDNGVSLPFVYI